MNLLWNSYFLKWYDDNKDLSYLKCLEMLDNHNNMNVHIYIPLNIETYS